MTRRLDLFFAVSQLAVAEMSQTLMETRNRDSSVSEMSLEVPMICLGLAHRRCVTVTALVFTTGFISPRARARESLKSQKSEGVPAALTVMLLATVRGESQRFVRHRVK